MARKRDAAGRTPDDAGYQPTYTDDMSLWTKQIIFGVHEAGTNRSNRYRYEAVPGDSFVLCEATTGWGRHVFSASECALPLYTRFQYKITLCGDQVAEPGTTRAVATNPVAMAFEPLDLTAYVAACEAKPGRERLAPPPDKFVCASCHGQLLEYLGLPHAVTVGGKKPAAERATPKRLEFLVLGHSPEGASGWPHPVTISVCARGKKTLVNFSMGPHIVNVGGQRTVTQVVVDGGLDEAYAEEFDACGARWLVPYLVRLAAGEDVSEGELVAAYEARFGHAPRTETSADYTT